MSAPHITPNFEGQDICLAPQSKLRVMGHPSSRVPPAWFSSSLVDASYLTGSNVPSSSWGHHRGTFKCIERGIQRMVKGKDILCMAVMRYATMDV